MILVLCLAMLHTAIVSVAIPSDPVIQVIPDLIAKGFDKILENQADNLYSSVGTNSTNASTLLTSMMYQKNEFLVNPGVQKMKDFTAFWYFVFYIIFLLVGGIGVMREAAENSSFGNDNGSWRNQYIEIAIFAPLVWAFYLFGLQWLFSLEWVLTKSAYLQTMDLIAYVPTGALDYLSFSIINVALIIALYVRYLIVGLVSAFFLLIAAAALFPPTRRFAAMLFSYGAVMLFSRFIMCMILVGGTSIMSGLPYPINTSLGIYFIIVLVAFIFTTACILYPILAPFIGPLKYLIVSRSLYGQGRR
ncbi:hypothetical protein [Candidatus Methanoperedens sp. BLZ2]|uniref:hypothetical protein n=1 Tax=Candidatus Methanoperedens sp. BLZ2 TaxID=2035255 RepID=UPI0011424D7A|nr:hypothetical protein [Candidatus Methanoperedens sp. BLZ2]KAB2945285.1 MAG: hypothetical protein F9K14_11665 [Candidatus Methanoperedens sp.]